MANDKPSVTKVPKLPTLDLSKRPSIFSGSKGFNQGGAPRNFTPIPVRTTQNKGSGSGK